MIAGTAVRNAHEPESKLLKGGDIGDDIVKGLLRGNTRSLGYGTHGAIHSERVAYCRVLLFHV